MDPRSARTPVTAAGSVAELFTTSRSPRAEVLAEVGEPPVHDPIGRGDHQLHTVAGDTVRLGWLHGVRSGWSLELRVRLSQSHASAPIGSRSRAR